MQSAALTKTGVLSVPKQDANSYVYREIGVRPAFAALSQGLDNALWLPTMLPLGEAGGKGTQRFPHTISAPSCESIII